MPVTRIGEKGRHYTGRKKAGSIITDLSHGEPVPRRVFQDPSLVFSGTSNHLHLTLRTSLPASSSSC